MKTGLVLEGGALRTIFSSGACDAFLDKELPLPDYTVGVSAGIAYGVSYLSRQSRRNLKLVTTYAGDRRYMGWRNMADRKNRSYFGLKFAYETIPNQLLPFDYDTFEAYPGTVEAVVTNLNTGEAEYLPVPRRDAHNLLLQATCAIPMMFPIIEIDGQPYLDGGCADAIPWRRAFDAGCDRVVVILTRERDYHKDADGSIRMIGRHFRKYPNFVETMRTRADRWLTPAGRSCSTWRPRERSRSSPPRTPWAAAARKRTWRSCGPCGSPAISPAPAAPRKFGHSGQKNKLPSLKTGAENGAGFLQANAFGLY